MRDARINPNAILGGTAALALVGGLLLHLAADPTTGAANALEALIVGVVLLLAVGGFLYRRSTPGVESPSKDEVTVPDSGLGRFLRDSKLAAPLYLGIRLAMAYEWLNAGWDKLQSPGFWLHAVTIPNAPANPAITYPAYRSFIQFMLDHQWYIWFAKLVVAGELLIGLCLLLGLFTGIAALAGLLMNFNFIYAGSTSINPTLIVLEAIVLYGWKVAGWYGLDQFVLLRLGTPWAPGPVPGADAPAARRTAQR